MGRKAEPRGDGDERQLKVVDVEKETGRKLSSRVGETHSFQRIT